MKKMTFKELIDAIIKAETPTSKKNTNAKPVSVGKV
jgi:hypothetical protein